MEPELSTAGEGIYDLVEVEEPRPAATNGDAARGPARAPNGIAQASGAPAAGSNGESAGATVAKQTGAVLQALSEKIANLGRRLERPPAAPAPAPSGGVRLTAHRRRAKTLRFQAPAWAVSVLIHSGLLGIMAAATLAPSVQQAILNIDSAPFDPALANQQAEELVHILNPVNAGPRDQAVELAPTGAVGSGIGTGIVGSAAPSATPRVGQNTRVDGRGLPGIKVVPTLSGLALAPAAPGRDLAAAGGGMVGGDVAMGTKDIGEALDQLAREILRQLQRHKVTVIWLFDESGSMKDDQRAIKEKFGRVANELKLNVGGNKKTEGALLHAIVGYGAGIDFLLRKPTVDIDAIGKAINALPTDTTGIENTCHALFEVVSEYSKNLAKDRQLLVVLVTDESGDDGDFVEEARQAVVSHNVPVYVIGRQSLFGYETLHLKYTDPITKDPYWPAIRRGPETADKEALQWDGLHDRWDEQPSGFAPYELARIAKDSGGIYFLLPSEEDLRVRTREKAYSITTLKEYIPDYESRGAYLKRRENSDLRKTLHDIIVETKGYPYRRHYSIELEKLIEEMTAEAPIVRERLANLMVIEKKLKSIRKLREHEPEKRWQASYDLMLAQIVAYQVKAYEYLACLDEMVAEMRKGTLKPKRMPIPNQLDVTWYIEHDTRPKAPTHETAKKVAEAKALLEAVIKLHPNTPWADLAQDEINRGFSCGRHEWNVSPQYNERAKLVPKY